MTIFGPGDCFKSDICRDGYSEYLIIMRNIPEEEGAYEAYLVAGWRNLTSSLVIAMQYITNDDLVEFEPCDRDTFDRALSKAVSSIQFSLPTETKKVKEGKE